MAGPRVAGRVITFYSYKGGTGRSMALANMAWILAAGGKRVLVIDWDLEAPGLHRYFKPFLIDHELGASDGLMDLIDRYASEAIRPLAEGESLPPDWWLPLADIGEYVLSVNFPHFPSGGGIDLLPAGRQSETYAVKVSAFNWQNFYDRLGGGGFLDAVRRQAQSEYDYVLIDSRTGVSDTAGICTAQLPDTLVVCFTYNNQSIKGAAAVAASAQRLHSEVRRKQPSDPAVGVADTPVPYRIYPVPMRVDAGESERLAQRQAFAREAFAALLDREGLTDPAQYWSEVEVPHRVFYAYEEVLAPFKDDPHDPKTVFAAFLRMTRYVTRGDVQDYRLPLEPALRQRLLEAFAETPRAAPAPASSAQPAPETEEQLLVRTADTALLALDGEQRELARSVLCRLVRVARDEEGGRFYPIRVALQDFTGEQHAVVGLLAQHGMLTVGVESRGRRHTRSQPPEQVVGFADERLVALWPVLQRWLDEDRDFLLWRQQLRDYRTDWLRTGERSALLTGTLLGEAQLWARKRPEELNAAEHGFIMDSLAAAEKQAQAAARAPVPPVGVGASLPMPRAAPAPSRRPLARLALAAGVLAVVATTLWFRGPGDTTQPSASVGTVPAMPPVPAQGATDAQQAAEIYKAGEALAALPVTDVQRKRRQATAVEYFAPPERRDEVGSALQSLGFKVALKDALIPGAVANCLWYSPSVDPEDVKAAALALIRAGLLVRAIRPIAPGAPGRDKALIQIGADASQVAMEPYTVARVQEATFTVPQVYIQFAGAVDRQAVIEPLRKALEAAGIAAPPAERINRQQSNEVRYFTDNEADRQLADRVRDVAMKALTGTGCPLQELPVRRNDFTRGSAAPVELWLMLNCGKS
ncbi:KGGVGR-motif variant AAA ATPase [Azohydromonas aeria]|uniref:KGGVGR-motif variant AAA ATPase n=1 Tax=Azohydromonas aeria TaxID=2590212 RepID=UPI0012F7C469|nr:AAA family ATPase [Azohydromonas aeria]